MWKPPFVLLDDSRPGRDRLQVFSDPADIVAAYRPDDIAQCFAKLARAAAHGLHAAGYLAYECSYAIEPRLAPLMPEPRGLPLMWFGLFRSRQEIAGEEAVRALEDQITGRAYAGPLLPDDDRESHGRKFAAIRDYILAGDAYQVNLTFPARFAFAGDPFALYVRLRSRAQGGYGAYVADGARAILSHSPELFFAIENGVICARPMKGTAARGTDPGEDARLRAGLEASEKDRAENLMIVDLIRNDLGRIARTGSVAVEDLFAIETYPTLHQMVSTVRADVAEAAGPAGPAGAAGPAGPAGAAGAAGPAAIMQALFPCGSVTGAPKIRAMEIIRALETAERGVYCGAVGVFSPDGSAQFNVAIRTLTIEGREGRLGIGSGIVSDSLPHAEYEECLLKARFYAEGRKPIALIETLRYDPETGFTRKHLHLGRMARSASVLGLSFSGKSAADVLDAAVAGATTSLRVRLQLDEDGALNCTIQALGPAPEFWTYAVSEKRVRSSDALLRHKTNWREFYESEFAALRAASGCDEAVFLNERGEITEGSRTNLFARTGGRLITPPLSSGLLDGCLRRALLDSDACAEGVLYMNDLDQAEAVYLGNSLRGLIPSRPA